MEKILLIENDMASIAVFDFIFNRVDFSYKVCRSVENILPIIEDFKPGLILLAYVFPLINVNGESLCNQIKRNRKTANIPVIIFSAVNDMFLSVGKYGCNAFIGKPFDPDYLVSLIQKYMFREVAY